MFRIKSRIYTEVARVSAGDVTGATATKQKRSPGTNGIEWWQMTEVLEKVETYRSSRTRAVRMFQRNTTR